jgi:regulator of RNase E activity RraA
MATTMRRLGVVAFVTNGGVRDIEGIRQNAPGFQVYACGAVPGAGPSSVVDIGNPVCIAGLEVRNGDLLLGDGTGLVTVPEAQLAEVVAEARRVQERELKLLELIGSEDFSIPEYFDRRRALFS